MKIGFCYDTKKDYGFDDENMEYTDFVSLTTIGEIKQALENNGHSVKYIGNVHKLNSFLSGKENDIDIFFNIAEGFASRNRESLVPCLLEIYNLPYTGSDSYGMALTLNKYHTKILAKSLDILTPNGMCFKTVTDKILDFAEYIGFPLILKPNSEGGSMGLYLVQNADELVKKSDFLIKRYGFELLIEEYIEGREITVPIIGNRLDAKALGVVAVLHEDGQDISLYDNNLKHIDNVINTLEHGLNENTINILIRSSLELHRALDLYDYSRMDFRVTSDGQTYFLEANPMPSLCRDGSFEQCGKALGMEYYEIIGKILDSAIKRTGLELSDIKAI